MKNLRYLKYLFLIITIVIDGYLIYQSTLKGSVSADKSQEVTDTVVNVIDKVNPSDNSITQKYDISKIHLFVRKLFGHFGAFMVCGLFALMTMVLFFKNNYLRFGLALANGIILAILTEVIQLYTEGRYGTIKDVLINIAGYICMMLLIYIVMIVIYYIKRRKNKNEKQYI